MDKIWYRYPSKLEVIDRCGGDEKTEWPHRTNKSRTLKTKTKQKNYASQHSTNWRLRRLTAHISADLPNFHSIDDRIIKRALNLFTQSNIHNIFNDRLPCVLVRAECWRSRRKSEKPHGTHIEIDQSKRLSSDAHTCTVGYVCFTH